MRNRRIDHLGLRLALADRLLPVLVAAMSFLAALALAGTLATAILAADWSRDSAGSLTIQVPSPTEAAVPPASTTPAVTGPATTAAAANPATRLAAALAFLQTAPGVQNPTVMSDAAVDALLTPWLGPDIAKLNLPIPAVITATWTSLAPPATLSTEIQKIAPGALVSTGAAWAARVAALTTSLQACAAAILFIVTAVAAAVVAVATRAGIAQRRNEIQIIHGLGAQDGDIAARFAARATSLTVRGAVIGVLLALPVLFWLAALAAPFAGVTPGTKTWNLPPALWSALPAIPLIAAAIGWLTAQLTVRNWLRRLV